MRFASAERQDLGGHAHERKRGVWDVEDVLVEMLDAFAGRDGWGDEGGEEGVGMEVPRAEEDTVDARLERPVGETHSALMLAGRGHELGDLRHGADVGGGEPGGEVGGGALAEE